MSLLEDIFLQDEANEAQELERVIEGDEFDERPRSVSDSSDESDGGRKEDEAEEDKRRVEPSSTKTKRVTKNPRFILNPARLTGPRGIQVIPEHFKDFKFKGKGHEKEDLDLVLKKLEHWAYRLYPKFQFQDCLKKIETLGKKRPVMVHLHKIRTDQFLSEETVVQKDSSDDEEQPPQEEDEFDKLLQQQIEIARATPAPGSVKKDRSDQWARMMGTPSADDRSRLPMPKATSSPSISDEQKERMLRNRRLAEERRLARLKQTTHINNTTSNTILEIDETEHGEENLSISNNIIEINNKNKPNDANDIIEINNEIVPKKTNRSQVIQSSDSEDECNMIAVNESIVVDVHSNIEKKTNSRQSNEKVIEDQEIGDNVSDVEEMTDDYVIANDCGSHAAYTDGMKDNCDHGNDIVLDKINNDVDVIVAGQDHDLGKDVSNINVIDNSPESSSIVKESDEITKDSINNSTKPAENDKAQSRDDPAEEFTDDIMDVDFNDDF